MESLIIHAAIESEKLPDSSIDYDGFEKYPQRYLFARVFGNGVAIFIGK